MLHTIEDLVNNGFVRIGACNEYPQLSYDRETDFLYVNFSSESRSPKKRIDVPPIKEHRIMSNEEDPIGMENEPKNYVIFAKAKTIKELLEDGWKKLDRIYNYSPNLQIIRGQLHEIIGIEPDPKKTLIETERPIVNFCYTLNNVSNTPKYTFYVKPKPTDEESQPKNLPN